MTTDVARRKIDYMKPGLGNMNGWQERHLQAIHIPNAKERPIVDLLRAWLAYADAYGARYEAGIGGDGYACDYWVDIAKGIKGLLNMDHGTRLDNGCLDTIINDTLAAEGIDVDRM